MNGPNLREEDSDGRQSSLSDDSATEHSGHQPNHHFRVLGEPLSDRSSTQSDQSGGHRPRTLIDAESRQAIDGDQTEDDSLKFFEEQERQIAMQIAEENRGQAQEDQQQLAAGEEETEIWREMMSRIEEEEDDENREEFEEEGKEEEMRGDKERGKREEGMEEESEREEGRGKREEEMEEESEREEGREKREEEMEEESEREEGREKREKEMEEESEREEGREKREKEMDGESEREKVREKRGEEMDGESEREKGEGKGEEEGGEENGKSSANSRISTGQESPPRSSYSRISESLQNREFPGAALLSHPEEIDGQQKRNSAQPQTEGYPIGYPTDPPPAYSSPRKERPGTAANRTNWEGSGVRFPVPSPFEMTLNGGDEHKGHDSEEEHSGTEHSIGATNIRSAIGNSLTLAGGMATAVLAAPSAADDPPKRSSPFVSPRSIGHAVDSPRGDAQRQSAAKVVQGARTVAELQQREKSARERPEKGKTETNEAQQTQQPKNMKENDADALPHFPISAELKALFGQIEEYVAERVEIVPSWKPFQIDYIPAVGEVDPFIKVPRPDENDELLLGLAVLDEPATQQSDSAIVDLRLHQMAGNSAADAPVKKLSRADKNAHQIDRWIQNVKELRRTKAPTRVVYGKPMPSIESLMQEWPSEVEQKLKDMKLLINANLDADLEDFVDLCLGLVDIPVQKSRLEALHVLFSLYAEFRASQHFRNMALAGDGTEGTRRAPSTNIDQFVVPD